MKVYISKPRYHWLSPYSILKYTLYLGRDMDYDDEFVEKCVKKLNPFCKLLQKILDIIHPEVQYVKVDYYDIWSMDLTLSYIILPMLKKIKNDKHGVPFIDNIDVPDSLKTQNDDFSEEKWAYVLNEMIFAFESYSNDWESQFHSGNIDLDFIPYDENGNKVDKKHAKYFELESGPNDTSSVDLDGIKKYQERIDNGLRLFGKYYQTLWT